LKNGGEVMQFWMDFSASVGRKSRESLWMMRVANLA